MKLHEDKKLKAGIRILKFVSGWIYWETHDGTLETNKSTSISCAIAGVFVPEPKFPSKQN